MIYPNGTLCTLENKDGGLLEEYVGREATVLEGPAPRVAKNIRGDVCNYEGYVVEVEGCDIPMFAKHVWLVPKRLPESSQFTEFMTKTLIPVDLDVLEEA